jgi:cadmium resistance protein CadD (predicted permease)
MADHILFALSSGLVVLSTNIDNLVMLLALMVSLGVVRAATGFLVAQGLILSLSLGIATGVDHSGILNRVGYLGFVPLILGLRGIWRQAAQGPDQPADTGAVSSALALFLSLSFDTLAAMTPLLAESTSAFRVSALVGAGISLLGLVALSAWSAPRALQLGPQIARLDRFAPYVMVLVGLYILINSPTDIL